MHTVKRAAELTGVPAATLRVWERRYGVVTPSRTEGGYRVYDDAALLRTEIDAEGRATMTRHDGERRVVEVRNAAGATKVFGYDPEGAKTLANLGGLGAGVEARRPQQGAVGRGDPGPPRPPGGGNIAVPGEPGC